jgi:hypothetical protein
MRRPAQHNLATNARTGWARPYTGVAGLAVFYNDGANQPPATPAVPTPADVAPPKNPPALEPLRDENGVIITQERFGQNMAKERRAGRHAAFRELAEAAGLEFDIDQFDPKKFGEMFKQADQARKAKLTEDEQRAEALRQQEETLTARAAAVEKQEQAARQMAHSTRIRAALVSLGASGADLEDAAALLRIDEDASDEDLARAASELKERRAEMFGGQQAPATPPPAPSGMPAPGMPRPGASQPKPGERGLAMLKRRGKIPTDA